MESRLESVIVSLILLSLVGCLTQLYSAQLDAQKKPAEEPAKAGMPNIYVPSGYMDPIKFA